MTHLEVTVVRRASVAVVQNGAVGPCCADARVRLVATPAVRVRVVLEQRFQLVLAGRKTRHATRGRRSRQDEPRETGAGSDWKNEQKREEREGREKRIKESRYI